MLLAYYHGFKLKIYIFIIRVLGNEKLSETEFWNKELLLFILTNLSPSPFN